MKNRHANAKRIISLMLVCMLALTALPTLAWADDCEGHVHTEDGGEILHDEITGDSEDEPEDESVAGETNSQEKDSGDETGENGESAPEREPVMEAGNGFADEASGGLMPTASCDHSDTVYRAISPAIHSLFCNVCGKDISSSPHNFSYGSWTNYSSTQHRRTRTCSTCGFSDYEYGSHESTSETCRPISSSQHMITVSCRECGVQISSKFGNHSFNASGRCTYCDYACTHPSSSRSYTTGCDWVDKCTTCGVVVNSGTTHGPYSYGSWSYYSSTQHRRTQTCDYGDWSGYDYASHSTTTSYGQYSSTQHSVRSYCSECGSYVGSTSYSSHSFTYGSWTNYSSTQHRRTKTCSICGYSEYEYESHSLNYGSWTSTGSSQHQRTVSCSCGYSTTETAAHTLTRTAWTSDGAAQHKRTASCGTCGYSTTEKEAHSLTDGAWDSISDTQHQRTKSCSCGYSTTETKSHELTYGSWTPTGLSRHKRTVSCSCGYSTTQTEPHDLVTGAWSSVSDTQHQRTTSCSCGYSTTETTSHSLTYGSWTQHDATQHKRTKSCSCGYSGTEYDAHNMVPGRWVSVSDTQHSRTNACECGHTATEAASHADSDGDGNCDSCQYLMTRFSVTVPTSLNLGMSQAGQIYAATTAQIVNNSTGAVTVTGVKFTTANGWTLVPYTTNMADAKVNSKRIGFTVNGAASTVTGSTEAKTTAWQIAKGASLPLDYAAVVSATSKAVNEQVLTVVFVVGWAS